MIFPYRANISAADQGDFLLLLRPEIPVTVVGPAGSGTFIGLVDTGSDNTILPKSIATFLGITVAPQADPPAELFGGYHVQLLTGEAILKLKVSDEELVWKTSVSFFDFPAHGEESIVLGHAGFLDYFTANFDGKQGILTLLANDELPAAE